MSDSKHTPTPWRVEQHDTEIFSVAPLDTDGAAPVVIDAASGHDLMAFTEAAANAAFIVKACNAHDELVAALRGVMRFALPITALDVQDFNRARAALAKVQA